MMTGKEIKSTARAQLIGRYSSTIPAVLLVSVVQFIVFLVTDSGASSMTPGSYLIKYAISLIVDILTGILLYGRCFFFLKNLLVQGLCLCFKDSETAKLCFVKPVRF